MFHCITSSFNSRFAESGLNSFPETFRLDTVNTVLNIILLHKVNYIQFVFTCVGLSHTKVYTRLLPEYL